MRHELTFITEEGVHLKTIPEEVTGRCTGCCLSEIPNFKAFLGDDKLNCCKDNHHIWVKDDFNCPANPIMAMFTTALKWLTNN